MKRISILFCMVLLLFSCSDKSTSNPPYVLEVTTFTCSPNVAETKFWEEDAEASMQKFMGDANVQTYAGMINGPSMEMTRYEIR